MASTVPRERRVRQREADELDTRADVRVALLAAEERGVLSLEELRACGLSRQPSASALAVAACTGSTVGSTRSATPTCRSPGASWPRSRRAARARWLSHFSAAAHLGIVRWDDRFPEVTVCGAATRVHRGLRVHRTHRLDPRDVARHDGVPITSPARTLLDLAAALDRRPLRRAVRQAQALHHVGVRQLLGRSTG